MAQVKAFHFQDEQLRNVTLDILKFHVNQNVPISGGDGRRPINKQAKLLMGDKSLVMEKGL